MFLKASPFGISVIICTHNGARRIVYTLEALERQIVQPDMQWEILLIDNGSTDETLKVADDFSKNFKRNIQFRIIQVKELGKSNALLKGYDEAKFELMLICDDDNWLQPEYLHFVSEIFRENDEIGLLGGYGIAEFRGEEKPVWFEKWQQSYACGKHHAKTGFLASGDASIWGAGSVIRKTLWIFLRENGFHFINNTGKGKMLGEDVELSHAVLYSGSKLYFDDRLWYYHDLSGGRITWTNLKKQIKICGCTLPVIYDMAFKNSPNRKNRYNLSFIKMIISLSINLLVQLSKKNNQFLLKYIFNQLIELVFHRKKYKQIYYEIFPWISSVKGSFPLKNTSL